MRRRIQLMITMLAAVALLAPALSFAAAPTTTAVEGILTAAGGGPVSDGDYQMTFAIYDKIDQAQASWTEGPLKVSVKGGRFGQILGVAKPLTAQLFGSLEQAWLGLKVGGDPELPRIRLHSVPYALEASRAASLGCSGCVSAAQLKSGAISADKIGFTYAGAKTKGGPADLALALQCTGCITVDMLKIDKDLDLGGNGLKAKTVAATGITATTVSAGTFQGDGSKLSGIKIPSGTCAVNGEVVKGIKPDGTLICVAAMDPSALPPDGLDEISNGLLTNQFTDAQASANTPVAIADNNPTGVGDELVFPDVGLAQKLQVSVEIDNSDLKTLRVELYDPNNKLYVLFDKGVAGKKLKATYPPTKTISGDLGTWIGKNPKGKWRLKVMDTGFLNNGKDGNIVGWNVAIQTLSSKKVAAEGVFHANKGLQLMQAKTHPTSCAAGNFGFMYANPVENAIFVCNGKEFVPIPLTPLGTQNNPAVTCKQLLGVQPSSKSGLYWIDPDGPTGGNASFQTWCDMTTDGGGWTLAIKGTLNGSYNASLNKELKDAKGFMKSFTSVNFKDVLVKMGDYETSQDWVDFYNVGNGNQTLDHRIKNCCSGSYSVDYNANAPHKAGKRSPSLANVPEMEALSLRMSQTSGPNDAMFFVVTRSSRSACNNYNPTASYRYVTTSCIGTQLGFGVGNYTWSNWTTWTGWTTGCSAAGYWGGSATKCTSSGGVFIR